MGKKNIRISFIMVTKDRPELAKKAIKTTIGEGQIGAGNDMFDLTFIDRYYRLLLNLSQLLVNDIHMPLESYELLGSPIVKDYIKKSAFKLS